MKSYAVVFDVRARDEALEAADYISKSSPTNADSWFAGLLDVIASPRTMPRRYGRARESETLGIELRQVIYFSHRIIFRVEEVTKVVRILHIRHSSRRTMGETGE